MNRKDFLAAVGITASSFALINCIGCSKSGGTASPSSGLGDSTGIDFTLDLSISANAALLNNGGYITANNIIVAKTNSGTYIAVQQSCTHESYPLTYQSTNQRFYCNNHGATFTEKGAVTNGPATRSLTVCNTTITGTSLRVYS